MVKDVPALLEMLKAIFDYVVDTVVRIAQLIKLWLSIHNQLGGIFGWLPIELYNILFLIFGIVIVYKLLGME